MCIRDRLSPERIRSLEAGIDRTLPGNAGAFGINLYGRATRDFIERQTRFDGARWLARPDNVGDARHWGMELSAKFNRATFLPMGDSLRAQLTLPRGAVEDARLGVTRPPRELPRYQFTLGYEGALPAWQGSWGFQWQRHGAVRTDLPGELAGKTRRRDLVDAHLVRRLDATFNLRLQLQNLLGADTRRQATAASGADAWRLETLEPGKRSWLVSLEGKW
ncbi:MAG: TonB-dependent receptor, partial [Rhodocyclaceae bacterium]|nr:TonB-dependent receptor [Rhodocyclaceae bacterium]